MSIPDLFSLHGKTAIVTGATGLLGRQHCLALAEAGANVVVADLNPERCRDVENNVPGSRHLSLGVDVTVPASLIAGRDIILEKYGHIDILVNNAAVNDMFENPALAAEQSKFENYPLEMWLQSYSIIYFPFIKFETTFLSGVRQLLE